ncbi:MAG: hypothetical protein Roseis2KO_40990 [Roseivirga sp.]
MVNAVANCHNNPPLNKFYYLKPDQPEVHSALMPTKEELEKQIAELRELIAENKKATNNRWSDSPWAIGLQILIAIAAVAIAWAQFNAAAIQTDLSSKQTSLQEFEIIKSLSTLRPDDTVAVDNLFDYIASLDTDLQQRFLSNNLNNKAVNYFTYKSYTYLFEQFDTDTVSIIGNIMTKVANYLSDQRMNHIRDNQATIKDHILVEQWMRFISKKTEGLSFQSHKELLTEYSRDFVTSLVILTEIAEHQMPLSGGFSLPADIDTSLVYRLIPADIKLANSIFKPGQLKTDLRAAGITLATNHLVGYRNDLPKIGQTLAQNYLEDKYAVYLLYLKESKDKQDFDKYLTLCEAIIRSQELYHDELAGISLTFNVPQATGAVKKKFGSNFRLWLDEEKLVSLKKEADEGLPYKPKTE